MITGKALILAMVFSDLWHHLLHLSHICQLLCSSVNRPISCSSPSVGPLAKLCLTLLGPHGLQSLLGYSVHGISQARIPQWVGISSDPGSSQPRDRTHVSCLAGGFFTTESAGKPVLPLELLNLLSALLGMTFCFPGLIFLFSKFLLKCNLIEEIFRDHAI